MSIHDQLTSKLTPKKSLPISNDKEQEQIEKPPEVDSLLDEIDKALRELAKENCNCQEEEEENND